MHDSLAITHVRQSPHVCTKNVSEINEGKLYIQKQKQTVDKQKHGQIMNGICKRIQDNEWHSNF